MELVINFPLFRQFQRFALVVCGWDEILSEDEKKLDTRKIQKTAPSPTNPLHPRRWRSHHFIREKQGRVEKVYSELASTQAVQSNGERVKRLPYCTMVSGQFDLNIGGAKTCFLSCSDPVEKAKTIK